MLQNTIRAPPGSLSGLRSTIAEKSQRSRGSMGLVMGVSLRCAGMIGRCAATIPVPAVPRLRCARDTGHRCDIFAERRSGRIGYDLPQTAEQRGYGMETGLRGKPPA